MKFYLLFSISDKRYSNVYGLSFSENDSSTVQLIKNNNNSFEKGEERPLLSATRLSSLNSASWPSV